jgi:DMSO/TMAO reductase YedYZ molybdopterin-dependent catalytic subunit
MSLFDDLLNRRKKEQDLQTQKRVPPGQSLTNGFPVLTYGPLPAYDLKTWDFRVWGEVEKPMRWSWEEFTALPTTEITCDIHCVTRWSKLDTVWEGIKLTQFVKLFGVKSNAKFVIAHCDGGYTTNLPIEAMLDDDVLLAYKYAGEPLTLEHGAPLRTLVPKRYFWKSAKFVRGLEFSTTDKPGFWELGGYHNDGDPWKEERFGRRGFGFF